MRAFRRDLKRGSAAQDMVLSDRYGLHCTTTDSIPYDDYLGRDFQNRSALMDGI